MRVSTAPTPLSPTTGSKKVEFAYDYMHRRIQKKVFDWTGSAWSSTPTADTRFVYDEWNLLLELDGLNSNAVLRKYTWGLDLSGQTSPSAAGVHGAGGIGGLLACHDTADNAGYAYFYDANGNVGQLMNTAGGSTPAASYDYDAYGQGSGTGAFAVTNPFRFSTKYFIPETGHYDYGRRFYDPRWGRWTSRDPKWDQSPAYGYVGVPETERAILALARIEADPNPNCFVMNCPSTAIDPVGLSVWSWLSDAGTRVGDWVDCMGACIEDNDPLPLVLGRLVSVTSGLPLPKALVAELAEIAGDQKLANAIRKTLKAYEGQSRYTTIPSVLAVKLKALGGKRAISAANKLRGIGTVAAPINVAYGLALAAIEAHCTGWCCGTKRYDPSEGNISKEIKRRFFAGQ